MRRLKYIGVLIMLLAGSAANGNSVHMFGSPLCGDWVVSRQQLKRTGKHSVTQIRVESWFFGFISGMVATDYRVTKHDILSGIDGDSTLLWVDNYCTQHPLNSVADASYKLFDALTNKAKSENR